MDFGVIVPQGWRLDLVGISDPTEAYETMTRVAQEADALGYHSIWLYDHFHTVPTPIASARIRRRMIEQAHASRFRGVCNIVILIPLLVILSVSEGSHELDNVIFR